MATQTLVVLTNQAITTSPTTFPSNPHGASLPTAGQLVATVDATTAPVNDQITIDTYFSPDGGTTWRYWVGFSVSGGPHTNKQGGSTYGLGTDWPGGNIKVDVTAQVACTVASVTVTITS